MPARVQYTFTFTNADPDQQVSIGPQTVKVYASATGVQIGNTLDLDKTSSVTVWSDATILTASTVDGEGLPLVATATADNPTVTIDDGVAPANSPHTNATSVAFAFRLDAYSQSANTGGASQTANLQPTDDYRVAMSCPPQLVAPTDGMTWQVATPLFASGSASMDVEVSVYNADGSEVLVLAGTVALSSDGSATPVMTGFTVNEQIGSDLALDGSGHFVVSTAGGRFAMTVNARLHATDLAL